MDPASGRLIDHRHPQAGAELSGRILVMPSGRGSSSSSSVLAEAIRAGTAPAGIILVEPDGIVVLGALVARELYGRWIPVVVLRTRDYAAIQTGDDVAISSGRVTRTPITRR
jgi:predicted aconitase with swiveling domain